MCENLNFRKEQLLQAFYKIIRFSFLQFSELAKFNLLRFVPQFRLARKITNITGDKYSDSKETMQILKSDIGLKNAKCSKQC